MGYNRSHYEIISHTRGIKLFFLVFRVNRMFLNKYEYVKNKNMSSFCKVFHDKEERSGDY